MMTTPQALTLLCEPKANVERYDACPTASVQAGKVRSIPTPGPSDRLHTALRVGHIADG